MANAHGYAFSHELSCCTESRNVMLGDVYEAIQGLFDGVANISFSRDRSNRSEGRPKFRATQIVFGGRECHDPRDRVYGMLGLYSYGNRLGIDPDYSLQLSEVYTKAFQSTIEEFDGDLQAICGLGFNSNHAGLPSWVPNLATPLDPDLHRSQLTRFDYQYQYYQASKGTIAKCSFEDGRIFRVCGVKVGLATVLTDPKRITSWEEALKLFPGLAKLANVPEYQSKASGPGYDNRYEMFWRTVVSDIVYTLSTNDYRRLLDDDFEKLQNLLLPVVQGQSSYNHHSRLEFTSTVCTALDNRSFFITEDDKFGTGPPHMEAGDEVWVLLGSRVPFILRPITNVKKESRSNAYNFIGDCYLHGFMDGEALDVGMPEVTVNLH